MIVIKEEVKKKIKKQKWFKWKKLKCMNSEEQQKGKEKIKSKERRNCFASLPGAIAFVSGKGSFHSPKK